MDLSRMAYREAGGSVHTQTSVSTQLKLLFRAAREQVYSGDRGSPNILPTGF